MATKTKEQEAFDALCKSGISLEEFKRRASRISDQPDRAAKMGKLLSRTFGDELSDAARFRLVEMVCEATGGINREVPS